MKQAKEKSIKLRAFIIALIMYVVAYTYINYIFDGYDYGLIVTYIGIVFSTEYLNFEKKRTLESVIWFSAFTIFTLILILNEYYIDGIGVLWSTDELFLFIHIFAVWWVISRTGKLTEKESGAFLPIDALNGFIIIPFGSFMLRFKTWTSYLGSIKRGDGKGKKSIVWILIAIAASIVLLIVTINLLASVDSEFGKIFADLIKRISLTIELRFNLFTALKFLVSLPVGMYLFGLIGGSFIYDDAKLENRRNACVKGLSGLKKVPTSVWTIIMFVFSLVYVIFFAMEGKLLFGAFIGKLPEGFIISDYAREGFFELIKVATIDYIVLLLVTRMAREEEENKAFKFSIIMLLVESIFFGVIALSKLIMYISFFGFTPLRLESTWLVLLVIASSILWIVNVLSKKKMFKYWMYYGAISLVIISIIGVLV